MAVLIFVRNLLLLSIAGSVWSAVPTDFDLHLEALDDITSLYIGEVARMKLTVSFPAQTSADTRIELLPTASQPTVFALRELEDTVEKGSNLDIGNSQWLTGASKHPNLDQTAGAGIVYNTRVVLQLDTVSNSGTSGTTSDSQLVIYYEIVLVSQAGHADNTAVLTSAGMEYMGETRIAVVQTSINVFGAKQSNEFSTPAFSINPPSEIEIMKPLKLALTMYLPYPASDVTISVSTMVGLVDELFVQKIQTRTVGEGFSYSVNPDVMGLTQYLSCPLKTSADFNTGTLINSESQRTSPAAPKYQVIEDITFQVEKQSIVGKTLTAAVGVTVNSEELYVTAFNLTVIEQSAPLTDPTSYELLSPTVSVVSPGFMGSTNLSIEIPTESNIDYIIYLRTGVASASAKHLSILAVTPLVYGANLPCEIHPNNIVFNTTNSTNDGPMDEGTAKFNVSNMGFETGSGVNTLDVEVVVMMMPSAVKDETHTLYVKVNGGAEKDVTFTVGDSQPYDESLNCVLKIENNCDDAYQSGTVVSFKVNVKTERSKTPGPMSIEAPIPNNLTDSPLAFHSASVISKGRNVICVQLGRIVDILSDWNSGSNENDRATMTLPLVCNIEVVDDAAEDEFVIEIKAKIKDEPNILNASSPVTIEIAVGMQISGNQIWVATHALQVVPPTDLMEADVTMAKRVNGLTLTDQYMPGIFPDDIVLQWSADNDQYHDTTFDWKSPVAGSGTWTIDLVRPVVARYVRVVNKNGNCMKDHVIESTNTDLPEMYGPFNMSGPLLQKFMLALDNNTDTCITLPNKDESRTTPYMWVEAKKSVFGLADTTKFSVTMVGEGIQCHNASGPQVTYLTFPKEASGSSFQGNKIICTHNGNNTVNGKIECNYECSCEGQDQCEKFSLLMLNSDTSTSYSLCDVSITEI